MVVLDGLENKLCEIGYHSEGKNIDKRPDLNLKECGEIVSLKITDWFTDDSDFEETIKEWVQFKLQKK